MTGKPNVEMQCGDAVVSIISDGEDIVIIADGMKIAKRGTLEHRRQKPGSHWSRVGSCATSAMAGG